MKKRILAAVLAAAMSMTLFVGCGSSGGDDKQGETGTESAENGEKAEEAGEVSSEWSGLPAEAGMPELHLDKDAVKSKEYTIGFAQCVMDHPYRTNMIDFAQEWCDEWGVKLVVMDGEGDTSTEVSNVESLISRGVDAIVISSHGGVALTPALAQAAEAGIPVVLIDGGKPYDDWEYATWMSTDDWELGKNAGEKIVADTEGAGKVLELQGTSGSSCTIGRNGGFLEAIEGTDLEVVFTQDCNWLRAEAIDVVTSVLQSTPDLKVVYSHNDEMALGAIEVIEAAGLKPGEDILVYSGGDYQTNAFEAIKAGKLACTELYNNRGELACQAAVHVLEGGTLPKKINLGTTMCTIENVDTETPAY